MEKVQEKIIFSFFSIILFRVKNMVEELIKVSIRNLSHHKTRTVLTLLGVIIGIASVVALISLGEGLTNSITSSIEQLGANNIFVAPRSSGSGFGGPSGGSVALSQQDLDAVKGVRNVDIAMPILFKTLPAKYNGQTAFVTTLGFPISDSKKFFSDVQHFTLAQGRFLQTGEANSVVLGWRIYQDSFTENVRLGSNIEINGKKMRVVGILEETGNSQSDSAILMSIDTLRDLSNSPKDEMTMILVRAVEDPKGTAALIEKKLENIHKEKVFVAMTTDQVLNQINQIFGVMSIVLAGIAGISLLVAAFGIMNTMLMSVLERTREIGIMKAIGATNHRILSLFLIESSLVGLIGGGLGILLGYGLSIGLSATSISFFGLNLSIQLNPALIFGMLAFATLVGAIAGTYPARRAAKMDPVEALRYE